MFPSVDTIPDIPDTDIDKKYTEVMSKLVNTRYTCLLKFDYPNERKSMHESIYIKLLVLETKSDKKNRKKDIRIISL